MSNIQVSTESRLMQDCYMWLHNSHPALRGLYFEIHNNAFSARSGAKHKAMGRVAGVADACLLLPNGRGPVFFEFKTETGKQSEVQKFWQIKVEDAGYSYYVICTQSEFITVISNLCQQPD